MTHTCEAVVVHCIDFRLQHFLNDWLENRFGEQNYDRVAWAGGVKDFSVIQRQIELSRQLHQVRKVILINHEDCGAYGSTGTKDRHMRDLAYAASVAQALSLEVEKYYLHLDGEFERIK
jgi:carbonic anhydrase